MKAVHMIAFVLLVVGGINWGLVALNYNLVESLLGSWPSVVNVVYLLVGVAAVFEGVTHKWNCKHCEAKSSAAPMSSGSQM